MLEQQRIEYLQAMGIQLWMPRQALDNAAESIWLAGSESNNSQLDVSGSTPAQGGHAADLLAGMGLRDTNKTAASDKITEVSTAQKQTSAPIQQAAQAQALQANATEILEPNASMATPVTDLTVPTFELHFSLWPCGILWVSNQIFEQQDHGFQAAVSYSLLGNTVPQASYSQFKWPYIEGSHEDQSMPVAIRALTAQWEFMSSQGARGWVATDSSSLQWLGQVASKALYSVNERSELYSPAGKKQLWAVLQTLSNKQVL
ncbi:MAG: hypothetical protein ACI9B7_001668 [Oleispira sp.]|jgi:hypothetical protein